MPQSNFFTSLEKLFSLIACCHFLTRPLEIKEVFRFKMDVTLQRRNILQRACWICFVFRHILRIQSIPNAYFCRSYLFKNGYLLVVKRSMTSFFAENVCVLFDQYGFLALWYNFLAQLSHIISKRVARFLFLNNFRLFYLNQFAI